ncbi:MAG: class I SAM-dependent DNA methyltransferase [Thermoanaerobaculia bacterium]
MTPETAAALQRINRDFYDRHAVAFSATRERPWPAWERVAEAVEKCPAEGARSVLDLGCGNGRLGRFLERRWGARLVYLGLDASQPLLEIARSRRGGGCFVHCDLLGEGLPSELPGEPFDLICAFGLLHHLPGFASRVALLGETARRLPPGGLLAVSFWQFGGVERFRRRMMPWELYNRTATEPIDPREVEEGDTLLTWGEAAADRPQPVRYCHWTTPAEAERLLSDLPLDPVIAFRADGEGGDLNLYRLLAAAATAR